MNKNYFLCRTSVWTQVFVTYVKSGVLGTHFLNDSHGMLKALWISLRFRIA